MTSVPDLSPISAQPARTAISHAFGLEVASERPIAGLTAGAYATSSPRRCRLDLVPRAEIERRWSPASPQRARELRYPDGRVSMSVDFDARGETGYLIDAPGYGTHLVSPRGDLILSDLPPGPVSHWQALLFAQPLPLAAALQGLGLLHAGAVSVHGGIVAFLAPSGTGKSSICAHLIARGGEFVTDDVLAFEDSDDGVIGHLGARLANLDAEQLSLIDEGGRRRLGRVTGKSDKLQLEPATGIDMPLPLRAVCFLDRKGDAKATVERFEPSATELLAGAFITYASTAEGRLGQLAASAAIARSVPTYRVTLPVAGRADIAAAALEQSEIWR